MSHSILVNAEHESAQALRQLVASNLPEGFELAGGCWERRDGLNVEPISVALISAAGAIVTSLITALATMWAARVKEKGSTRTPTITIALHAKEMTIRIQGGVAEAIASAQIPEDPAMIVEVTLGSE